MNAVSKMGRPSEITPEIIALVAEAVDLVADGMVLKSAQAQVGITRHQFRAVLARQQDIATSYARAREISADYLVDEAIEVVKSDENPQKARNIADMNRWAAGKFNNKRFGDRIDLNVSQTLDVRSVIGEMQARRLRPASDQQDIADAQLIDEQGNLLPRYTDTQSVFTEPDIFSGAADAPNLVAPDDEIDIFS